MKDIGPRVRRRWVLGLLAVCGILGLLAWWLLEYAVDADRYRPQVVAALREAAGLPVTIGRLDFDLLPYPRIEASSVTVGEGDFQAALRRAEAGVGLLGLLRRQMDFHGVYLSGLVLRIPEDPRETARRVDALLTRLDSSSSNTSVGGFATRSIGTLSAPQAVLYAGERAEPLGRFDVYVRDLLSETPNVAISGSWSNPSGTVRATFGIARQGDSLVDGSANLDGIRLDSLLGDPRIPKMAVQTGLRFSLKAPGRFVADVEGTTASLDGDEYSGPFVGTVWWDDGALTVNDLIWNCPNAQCDADVTRSPDGAIACGIRKAHVGPDGVKRLIEQFRFRGVSLAAGTSAGLDVSDMLAGVETGGPLRIAKGQVAFKGLSFGVMGSRVALDGVRGSVEIDEGLFRVRELAAEGVALAGTVVPDFASGTAQIDLAGEAELSLPLVAMFAPVGALRELSGRLKLRRVTGVLGGGPGSGLVVESTLEEGRAAMALPTYPAPVVFSGLEGDLAYAGEVLRFDHLSGEGFALSGALTPQRSEGRLRVEAAGRFALAAPSVQAVLPKGFLSDAAGDVRLTRFAGTFAGAGIPDDFECEADLEGGRASVVTPLFTDTIADVSIRVAATKGAIEVDGEGSSAAFGPIEAAGRLDVATFLWKGTAALDTARVAKALMPDPRAQSMGETLAPVLGATEFEVTVALPSPDRATPDIVFSRAGEPPVHGYVSFLRADDAWRLDTLALSAKVPVYLLKPFLPAQLLLEGLASVEVEYRWSDPLLNVRADLTECRIADGEMFGKAPGDPLRIMAGGNVGPSGWLPRNARLEYRDTVFDMRWTNGRLGCETFDIDLASLRGLLPPGGDIWGRVRGRFLTTPLEADVALEATGFRLEPPIGVDDASGGLAYKDGVFTLRDVRVRGANSDCTFNGGLHDGAWQGQVIGEKLDVNALRAVLSAVRSLRADEDKADMAPRGWGRQGAFHADLQTVYYKRGELAKLHADVSWSPQGWAVDDLRCQPYGGVITGTARIPALPGPGTPFMELHLFFDSIDARILDEIAFKEPRELAGLASGEAQLRVPLGKGDKAVNETSGSVTFAAKNGSLGKLGFATKLLTVLGATEIVRLRVPSLKDRGLAFDTCAGRVVFETGFMTLQEAHLENPSVAMIASGTVDFPKSNSDVLVKVNLLESVSTLVGLVPVVGEAASKVTELTCLHFSVKGSPYEPEIRLERIQRLGDAPKKAGGAAAGLLDRALEKALGR